MLLSLLRRASVHLTIRVERVVRGLSCTVFFVRAHARFDSARSDILRMSVRASLVVCVRVCVRVPVCARTCMCTRTSRALVYAARHQLLRIICSTCVLVLSRSPVLARACARLGIHAWARWRIRARTGVGSSCQPTPSACVLVAWRGAAGGRYDSACVCGRVAFGALCVSRDWASGGARASRVATRVRLRAFRCARKRRPTGGPLALEDAER